MAMENINKFKLRLQLNIFSVGAERWFLLLSSILLQIWETWCYKAPAMTGSKKGSDPFWVYYRQLSLAFARD